MRRCTLTRQRRVDVAGHPLTVGAGVTQQRKPRPPRVDDDLDVPEFLK